MGKYTVKPILDVFAIRVTKQQKEMLQELLAEAEERVNEGRDLDTEYKIRQNDVAIEVLTRYVPLMRPKDFK